MYRCASHVDEHQTIPVRVKGEVIVISVQAMPSPAGAPGSGAPVGMAQGDGVTSGRSVSDTVARLAALPGVGTASDVTVNGGSRRTETSGTSEAAEAPSEAGVHGGAGRVLPVSPLLADLLPWGGLRRGSTVAVSGSTALLLALLSEATAGGSWAAVVGLPRLGVVAAAELGVAIHRMALIPRPGADFAQVTGALLDGVDVVVASSVAAGGAHGTDRPHAPEVARRLSARARNRGSVLVTFGSWPGAEVELRCHTVGWSGTADGYGHLERREVVVEATGRRGAARPRRTSLSLPGSSGVIEPAEFTATAGKRTSFEEVCAG